MQTEPTDAEVKVTMRAYAYPNIKWYNFFPYAFEKKKARQLQQLVNDNEAVGNTVIEILHSPFIRFILVAVAGV